MKKIEIAKQYRRKYGMEMPTIKLARIIYAQHNLTFKDVEEVRTTLRYVEGKKGKIQLKGLGKKTEFVMADHRTKTPYKIPKSDEENFIPFVIPEKYKRGLIINDIHLPYHNEESLIAVFNFGKKFKPDFIFINGDLLDFHQLSYFMKDPRKKRFSEELEMMKNFIEELNRIFKCKIFYKFGNHEERYDHFLFQKAHELVGVEEFNLEEIIKKRVPNVEIIRDKRIVVMNGLPFIHGHEFGRGIFNPVNAARGLFLQAKHSAVKGDCHTTSEHVETNIFGNLMTTWSIGCLCGLKPKWLPLNKWNHGFATIELMGKKNFKLRNYRIHKGQIL